MKRHTLVIAVGCIATATVVPAVLIIPSISEPDRYERVFDYEWRYQWSGGGMEDRFFWSSWSSDGEVLITNHGSTSIAFWDNATGESLGLTSLPSLNWSSEDKIMDIEANPVANVVAVASSEGVWILDFDGDVQAEDNESIVTGVAWSPSGDRIAISRADSSNSSASLQILAYPGLGVVSTLDMNESLEILEWSPDSSFIAGCSRWNGSLLVFDSALEDSRELLPQIPCQYSISWSPISSTLLIPMDKGLVLIDAISGEEIDRIPPPPQSERKACGTDTLVQGMKGPYSGALSSDGGMIAIGYQHGVVEVWNENGEGPLDTLLFRPCVVSPPKEVYVVSWSPTSPRVAAVGENGITVWVYGSDRADSEPYDFNPLIASIVLIWVPASIIFVVLLRRKQRRVS